MYGENVVTKVSPSWSGSYLSAMQWMVGCKNCSNWIQKSKKIDQNDTCLNVTTAIGNCVCLCEQYRPWTEWTSMQSDYGLHCLLNITFTMTPPTFLNYFYFKLIFFYIFRIKIYIFKYDCEIKINIKLYLLHVPSYVYITVYQFLTDWQQANSFTKEVFGWTRASRWLLVTGSIAPPNNLFRNKNK